MTGPDMKHHDCLISEPDIKNGSGWGFTDCRALSVAISLFLHIGFLRIGFLRFWQRFLMAAVIVMLLFQPLQALIQGPHRDEGGTVSAIGMISTIRAVGSGSEVGRSQPVHQSGIHGFL